MVERHIGRFELSHSPTMETPPGMVQDIIRAADIAYDAVGPSEEGEAYESSRCIDIYNALVPELSAYRIKPASVTYLYVPHLYPILFEPLSQKPIIADCTWQQMLSRSERTAEKPKVLIGTSQEVVCALRSYGLTQEQTIPWTFK